MWISYLTYIMMRLIRVFIWIAAVIGTENYKIYFKIQGRENSYSCSPAPLNDAHALEEHNLM